MAIHFTQNYEIIFSQHDTALTICEESIVRYFACRAMLTRTDINEILPKLFTSNYPNKTESVWPCLMGSSWRFRFSSSEHWARLQTRSAHDDVIKWKHFPRYWPFVRWIHRSPVNSPHKGQWRRALMFSLICAWINCWVNNRGAGDLRCHRAHYDVIVMNDIAERIAEWGSAAVVKEIGVRRVPQLFLVPILVRYHSSRAAS